jgi:hypothetical protein
VGLVRKVELSPKISSKEHTRLDPRERPTDIHRRRHQTFKCALPFIRSVRKEFVDLVEHDPSAATGAIEQPTCVLEELGYVDGTPVKVTEVDRSYTDAPWGRSRDGRDPEAPQ